MSRASLPPAGEFFLNEKEDNPVVLVSGGVGLRPMVSMLEHWCIRAMGGPSDMIADTPFLEHVCIRFLDGLPTVNRSCIVTPN